MLDATVTIIGNLTADPELRYTQGGLAVVNFTIAHTPRTFDKATNQTRDGETLFLRASCWRELAEHVAASLTSGTRVIATGRLKQRNFETNAGEKRVSVELEVEGIGPDLRYATATTVRAPRGSGAERATSTGSPTPPLSDDDPDLHPSDAWTTGDYPDETPF